MEKKNNMGSITRIIGIIRAPEDKKETDKSDHKYTCPYCGSSNAQIVTDGVRDEGKLYHCNKCNRTFKIYKIKKNEKSKVKNTIDPNGADKWMNDTINDICKKNNIKQNDPKNLMEYLLKDYIAHHKDDTDSTKKESKREEKVISNLMSINDVTDQIYIRNDCTFSIDYIGPRGKGIFTTVPKDVGDLVDKWTEFCFVNGYSDIVTSKCITSYEFGFTLNQKKYLSKVKEDITDMLVANNVWNNKMKDDDVFIYLLRMGLSDYKSFNIEYPHIGTIKFVNGTTHKTLFKYLFNDDEVITTPENIEEIICNG